VRKAALIYGGGRFQRRGTRALHYHQKPDKKDTGYAKGFNSRAHHPDGKANIAEWGGVKGKGTRCRRKSILTCLVKGTGGRRIL